MFPYFILFGRPIYMYVVMAIIGALVAGFFVCKQIKKRGLDDNDAIIFMLIVAAGIYVGSHLLFAITNMDKFYLITRINSFQSFIDIMGLLFSGSVFYGGLIGGAVAGLIYLKAKKLNIPLYLDICAVAVPLFHGIARIGCFCAGCCYGIESKFGFVFTRALDIEANGVRRFPVQLLESCCNLLLALVLWQFLKRGKFKNNLLCGYLLGYSIIRFSDEFLRGDTIRGFVFSLSTSQFISLIVFLGTVIYLVIAKVLSKINAGNHESN